MVQYTEPDHSQCTTKGKDCKPIRDFLPQDNAVCRRCNAGYHDKCRKTLTVKYMHTGVNPEYITIVIDCECDVCYPQEEENKMKVIIERTLCELDLKYDDEEKKLEFVVTDLETDNKEPWTDYAITWENNFESYEEAKEFYLDADWVDELGYLNTKLSIVAIDEEMLLVSYELKEEFKQMYELIGAKISDNHETVFLDEKYIEMIDEPIILGVISDKYEFQEWFSNENFSQIQETIIRKNIKNKNKTISVNITQVDEDTEYKYIKTENYSIFVNLLH